jgi:ribose 5-phosphate isomerase A
LLWRRGSVLSEQNTADALAQAALVNVSSGMLIGLGAGKTAARGIRALAERVREDNLDIECVAASEVTEELGRELGLKVAQFAAVEQLDILIDGADEVDTQMRVMKGSRGAMTRERILAWASKHTVFMVDAQKATDKIGTHTPLPVAVMAFGLKSTRKGIRELGLRGVCRRQMDGDFFITDNGNLVIDIELTGSEDLSLLASQLNDLPGVIDHGLFLTEADTILIDRDGEVERLERE